MKKRKKKNAITLLALVITIVIMLLLAGVAIQMTMGENGLIAKSVQAQKEQAKAELYDTAKLSYMSLNAKALENGQPSPQAELALSTIEFRDKYDIVGDDITDKKGTVIESKLNLINELNKLRVMSEEPEISMKGEYVEKPWPKKVSGVTIPEEDKDKMVLKLKVLGNNEKINYGGNKLNIDYGNGDSDQELNSFLGKEVEYIRGEYIIKISGFREFIRIKPELIENVEIEVLQWGKLSGFYHENYVVDLTSVTKIYEPEPDKVDIFYRDGKMIEIPEWLFSKKVTSTKISKFIRCKNITTIPEGLFKNNVNVTNFEVTFYDCIGLTSIPEGLFKNNVNAKDFGSVFRGCTGLTSIPENLFKNNVNADILNSIFEECSNISYIPDKIIETVKKVKENGGHYVYSAFQGCTSASNYNSIPAYMK